MKKFYYIEGYFKGDERPYLLGNKHALYVSNSVESATNHLKDTIGEFKIVEAFEHYQSCSHLYPHLKPNMTQNELYSEIESEIERGVTTII